MSRLDKLHDFIGRAGPGATIMVSPPFYDTLRHRSSPHDWQWFPKGRAIYRGLSVRVHDEWSWGWMVRKADGSFVEALAMEAAKPTRRGAGSARKGDSAGRQATPKTSRSTSTQEGLR